MPTAFAATWSRGRGGPVLGSYAEYDAVPGNSQQIAPRRAPREGLHPWTAGHTDPHSAARNHLARGHVGDEGGDGKAQHPGDAALLWRARGESVRLKAGACGEGILRRLRCLHLRTTRTRPIRGHGRDAVRRLLEHRCHVRDAQSPRPGSTSRLLPIRTSAHAIARCPGAIDALCLMYTTTKYTKEAMYPACRHVDAQ